MIKRILAILIVLSILCTSAVFAEDRSIEELYELYMSDITDINRVYKYDLAAKSSSGEEGEKLNNINAVNAMLALGILDVQSDGTFNEDGAVPLRDYAQIIMNLAVGSKTAFENNYADYPENRYTTHKEAMHYLVGILGYDAWEVKYPGENSRYIIADKIGLLDGISYNGEKNITRGELSQMIYNALTTDMLEQTSYGDTYSYEAVNGNNLLYNRFDAVFVKGIVTAQYGLNMISNAEVKEGTIHIDGATYYVDSTVMDDMLGYTAFAIARIDEAGRYRLLGICVDEENKTVAFDASDITDMDKSKIYYKLKDGSTGSAKTSKIKTISVNGNVLNTTDIYDVISDIEGEIRICPDINDGSSLVFIISPKSYKVFGISLEISERIFLDHGSEYKKDETFIDLKGKRTTVIKNGKEAAINDIAVGDIISIIENDLGTDILIFASDTVINGKIDEVDDDVYYIDNNPYRVSECYDNFCKTDSLLPELDLETAGDFYLDYSGKIASYNSDGTSYKLGYLRQAGMKTTGLDAPYLLRVYTTDNEWKEFELAKTITLDGTENLTPEKAVNIIVNSKEATDNLIRYKLNGDGKVTFIDTARKEDAESGDTEAISKDGEWANVTNWTAANKGYKSMGQYVLSSATKVFTVPENRNNEEDYAYAASPSIGSETHVSLILYNINEFSHPSIVIQLKGASAGGYANNYSFMIVTKLARGLDEDGEETVIVQGYDGTTTPLWQHKSFSVAKDYAEKAKSLKVGDIIQFNASRNMMSDFEVRVKAEDIGKDVEFSPTSGCVWGMGKVLNVEPSKKWIKIQAGETVATIYAHSLGLYDRGEKKGYEQIAAGEVQEGDIIFMNGGCGYMRSLIIR